MPAHIASLFLDQVLRPIKKDNGKLRNISLMECVFKFASGVIQDAVRQRCPPSLDCDAEGLHWTQYGGQPAGPELMLMVHQGLMKLRPRLAYCSLDAENAYGAIKRSAMLRGTVRWCPANAPFLACQWSSRSQAWIQTSACKWEQVTVAEGTAQGDTSSTLAFSRGLRVALEESYRRCQEQAFWVHLPSLVDDLLLVADPGNVEEALAIVREELRNIGLELNLSKCAAYIPARSQAGEGPDNRITSLPQVSGGLPALGSAYGGEFESVVGPLAVAAEPATRRLRAAKELASECGKYRHGQEPESSWHASWHLLQRVAAKALVYDVRTLEPSASLPLAQELDQAIAAAAKELLDVCGHDGWTADTDQQLQWPSELGGMAFGSAELSARVARLAALGQCLPTARRHLRAILPEATEDEILGAVPLSGADDMLRWLREKWGIEISATGTIAREREPRWDLRTDFAPLKGLTGTLTRAIQTRQFEDACERHAAAAARTATAARTAGRADAVDAARLRSDA